MTARRAARRPLDIHLMGAAEDPSTAARAATEPEHEHELEAGLLKPETEQPLPPPSQSQSASHAKLLAELHPAFYIACVAWKTDPTGAT